jgi:L-fuculose-phosphate aldolase
MSERQRLLATMQALAAAGLNTGASGNTSLRLPTGMLITPSGIHPERLTAEQLVEMALDGTVADSRWRPSSEWHLHAAIYRARTDVAAIVHCHSRCATALASCRRELPPFHYMVAMLGGPVHCSDYALFGTEALASATLTALGDRHACLLANHGQVTVGTTLEQALTRAQLLESLAASYLDTLALGGPVLLDERELAEAFAQFRQYGYQPLPAQDADGINRSSDS